MRQLQIILEEFVPELVGEERLCDWFQQDSATAYIARASMQVLSDVFVDRIIKGDI
jgi:hypothetical protein